MVKPLSTQLDRGFFLEISIKTLSLISLLSLAQVLVP